MADRPVARRPTTAPMDYPVVALTVMVVVAAVLTLVAGAIYRRRDAPEHIEGRNHEDRSSSAGIIRLRPRLVRPGAVLARGHVPLLAGMGFHRRVRRSTMGPTLYLAVKNPEALQRRMKAGPSAETRPLQKVVITGTILSSQRYSCSARSTIGSDGRRCRQRSSFIGNVLVFVGLGIGQFVVIQNNYAAANITVEADQRVVSTGLYGLVRHPMYFGTLIMMVGTPLALDSYWGLVRHRPCLIVFAVRITDEEKMLERGTRRIPGVHPEGALPAGARGVVKRS